MASGVSGNDFWEFGNGNGNGYWIIPIPKSGNGKGMEKTQSQNSGAGREQKKPIPIIRELESEAFILGNGREQEFPLTPEWHTIVRFAYW